MSKYRGYNLEPPKPEPIPDSTVVGKCPICGEPIYYGDKDIFVIEGLELMIHEDCMIFREEGLSHFLDLLGIDSYKVTAKEIFEEGF